VIRRHGTLFVVSAPSGAGKTTLCREMRLRLPDLAYSVSVTTRAPRAGEIDGADFRFVTEAEFRAMLARGEFAEWATVHGNLYGTRARRWTRRSPRATTSCSTSIRRARRSSGSVTRRRCSCSSWRRP